MLVEVGDGGRVGGVGGRVAESGGRAGREGAGPGGAGARGQEARVVRQGVGQGLAGRLEVRVVLGTNIIRSSACLNISSLSCLNISSCHHPVSIYHHTIILSQYIMIPVWRDAGSPSRLPHLSLCEVWWRDSRGGLRASCSSRTRGLSAKMLLFLDRYWLL